MALAATIESGVTAATTSVTSGFNENMNASVSTMVSTPVKNCWKVMTRPLENWSTSVTMRFTTSPWRCESRYERGRRCSLEKAATRMSRTTSKATRLVSAVSSHCETAVPAMDRARRRSASRSPAPSTSPGPTRQSTARPESTGTSRVVTVTAAASSPDVTRVAAWGERKPSTRLRVPMLEARSMPAVVGFALAALMRPPPRGRAASRRSRGRPRRRRGAARACPCPRAGRRRARE